MRKRGFDNPLFQNKDFINNAHFNIRIINSNISFKFLSFILFIILLLGFIFNIAKDGPTFSLTH